MSKYTPGLYHVISFDRLGARQDMQTAETYHEAQTRRDAAIAAGASSGVILRVISNSLIRSRAWDATADDEARAGV